MFFLQAQSFLERETVRLIHFKSDVSFANPGSVGNDQRSIFGGHLLDADDDLHAYLMIIERELIRVAQASARVILTFDYHNSTQAEACATRPSV